MEPLKDSVAPITSLNKGLVILILENFLLQDITEKKFGYLPVISQVSY
jgi:hypothetical protein